MDKRKFTSKFLSQLQRMQRDLMKKVSPFWIHVNDSDGSIGINVTIFDVNSHSRDFAFYSFQTEEQNQKELQELKDYISSIINSQNKSV